MAKIKNEDLIWVRPDIKFDGDYVLGSKHPALEKPPAKARGGKRSTGSLSPG